MLNRKLIATCGALALTFGLAACGGDDGGSATEGTLEGASITVGSKDFDEQLILGNISKLALENAGADVTDEINTGGTDVTRAALTSGEIDTYWEYNGTAWISFFKETEPIADRIEQYEVVAERDLEENDLHWLQPAEFNNTYALAFPSEAAEELGNPETLSDLADLIAEDPDAATLCVESEFSARDDGLPGMEETYGYQFPKDNVTVLDTAIVYSAADKQDPCNFGEVFTSDGRVSALDLTVLEDDQGFFPLYNPSPVFTDTVYSEYGEELDAIFDPISAALTQEEMTALNERVSVDLELPEDVAEDWMSENGFI
ncbi:glycine betaine ABC transporter substrate-binding protein [Nocardioides euryhalodurans]|uniref:Glycine betaine ABC transporter substrate-binding protein n=1 Tax=Nocardioides euryhalodurans TaxID=2518370 RepID=A0A4P7GL05_9ACTN|nr:glycine betaine ABC transporter substrate-binding protein [Nocardioides euryhalodurans]QBR92798.1 glycine betaine ABC transporter substrate-binding protein [Nocardioides euryhalodurans]